jgi:hypothetical protein
MSGTDRPEQTIDDGILAEAKPACVALVPVTPPLAGSRSQRSRPNSTFITHLIATAEQAPQTRGLRRATPADAQTAYNAKQHAFQDPGFRTRQSI